MNPKKSKALQREFETRLCCCRIREQERSMEKNLKYIHKFYEHPDELKMHLLEIWHDETHSYSTNGFVLLRAPGKYGKSIKDGKFPDAHDFKYDELEKALDSDAMPECSSL